MAVTFRATFVGTLAAILAGTAHSGLIADTGGPRSAFDAFGASSPRLRDAPNAKGRKKRKSPPPALGPHVFVGTKIDLPLRQAFLRAANPAFSYYSQFGVPGGWGGADLAYGIGYWGSSYFLKKELDERMQSKTLTAPVWRQQDFALLLLLPFEETTANLHRGEFHSKPVGGILRLGLFGSSPDKKEQGK